MNAGSSNTPVSKLAPADRDRELMELIKKPNLTKAETQRLIDLNLARLNDNKHTFTSK